MNSRIDVIKLRGVVIPVSSIKHVRWTPLTGDLLVTYQNGQGSSFLDLKVKDIKITRFKPSVKNPAKSVAYYLGEKYCIPIDKLRDD